MFRTVLALLTFSAVAGAATISFATPGGALDTAGDPVSASGTITTNANGTVSVTLTNTFVNLKDAGQLLTDLFFTLGAPPTTTLSTTTTPTSGSLINIDGNGVATASGDALATWGLTSSGAVIHLDSLAGGATQSIIGPGGAGGVYTNGNGSIDGNSGHNPFLTGDVTFNFAVGGVTAATTISSPVFSFGTTAGDNVGGCIVGATVCTAPTVPEPISSALVGTGLVGLFFLRRRVAR
jgi:hypothetical protein